MAQDRLSRAHVLLGCAILATACSDPEAARPNVVVMISDDQAAGTLGVLGHPELETPSLDRLARAGALFTNAFVTTSLCSPSRVSFLTGQWARTHGVITNSQPLDPAAVTYVSLLNESGYETACFGKWHMGAQPGPRPGFETWASYDGQGDYLDCDFDVDGEVVGTAGFVDDVATDYALAFLRRPHRRPFLAYLGFKSAHGPRRPAPRFGTRHAEYTHTPPESATALPPFPRRAEWDALALAAGAPLDAYELPSDWADGFERHRDREEVTPVQAEYHRAYYRLIDGIDENVGRVLDTLDELGLARETIVVFASDNGYSNGAHSLSGKRSAYEESMRIVFTMRGPGVEPGLRLDQLVLNVDLAPTLLDLCGVDAPAAMQGRSMTALLAGDAVPWRRDFLYEYYRESDFLKPWTWFAHAVPTLLALRTEDAKLVVYTEYPAWTQLFRLDVDPGETRNLAGADPGEASLRERLERLDAELGPKPKAPR